jgi:ABC-type nitrate/sulfonate/bicarbonate transport system permease component
MRNLLRLLHPFGVATVNQKRTLMVFWAASALAIWQYWPGAMIPRPGDTLQEFVRLWNNGLLIDVEVSLWVIIRAGAIAFLVGCGLGYLYTLPVFKAPILLYASMRNIMMNAVVAVFLMISPGGDTLKVGTMVFMMSVYFVSSNVQRIDSFSREEVDHAVTMRMSAWQTLWHCVVRGKLHLFGYDFIPCLGMGWSMLSFVEGLSRSQGGMGDLMIQMDKISSLSGIMALAVLSGALGFGIWYSLRRLLGSVFSFAGQTAVRS